MNTKPTPEEIAKILTQDNINPNILKSVFEEVQSRLFPEEKNQELVDVFRLLFFIGADALMTIQKQATDAPRNFGTYLLEQLDEEIQTFLNNTGKEEKQNDSKKAG